MSLKNSPLQAFGKKSTLGSLQPLGNGGTSTGSNKNSNALAVTLPLTSLIDAFAIIVIYLLIGTQTGGVDSSLPSRLHLPLAENGRQIFQKATTVRIEKDRYYIDDREVSVTQLGARLAELQQSRNAEKMEIVIQGDRAMTYASLDPLIRAGSAAGIQKLKFAVTPEP